VLLAARGMGSVAEGPEDEDDYNGGTYIDPNA
jgi:hypothetical protein